MGYRGTINTKYRRIEQDIIAPLSARLRTTNKKKLMDDADGSIQNPVKYNRMSQKLIDDANGSTQNIIE